MPALDSALVGILRNFTEIHCAVADLQRALCVSPFPVNGMFFTKLSHNSGHHKRQEILKKL